MLKSDECNVLRLDFWWRENIKYYNNNPNDYFTINTYFIPCFLFIFSDIPYLRVLHLHHNQLQKVEANAFEMIPQLVSLDLSHCGIKKVAAKAFAQLTTLEKLFLQHNQITELRQKTVESITGKGWMVTRCMSWIVEREENLVLPKKPELAKSLLDNAPK